MVSGYKTAKKHTIEFVGVAPSFFEGALLGNGSLGAVINTRPDAIVIHLGHNSIWDIRKREYTMQEIGTFKELFKKISLIDPMINSLMEDKWYKEYNDFTNEKYLNNKFPRPFPCGSLFLFFEKRRLEILSHSTDISVGLVTIRFCDQNNNQYFCKILIDQNSDTLIVKCVDEENNSVNLFNRMKLIPDEDIKSGLPLYNELSSGKGFIQRLPFYCENPRLIDDKDKGFVTYLDSINYEFKALNTYLEKIDKFEINITVKHGLYKNLIDIKPKTVCKSIDHNLLSTKKIWQDFWNKSAIKIEDKFLEEIWYWNLYFLRCILNEKTTCPGLFGNFMYKDIGTAWHGDYHMNYNTQQIFWSCFITNHSELHFPYVSLVEHLLPISKKWAKEYYELNGAYFPHSAYPAEMTTFPYPTTDWGWEICETPWTVQSLWWHFEYTQDTELLKNRLFEPIKQAVLFLVEYITRPIDKKYKDNDDNFHIFPTVVPELYALTPGFSKNKDCIVDLSLTKFVMKAFLKAVKILGIETEKELCQKCNMILNKLSPHPKNDNLNIFLNIENEDSEIIQNTPDSLVPVFPGEEITFSNKDGQYITALNTYKHHRNEGGNDLVFYNLQGARLGALDLEKFKRHISYCLHPNKTCTNRISQSGGRYRDDTDFDYMKYMGIWAENFSLSGVISNCLVHTHDDTIVFFPNWDLNKSAEFNGHLAFGGFLVGAKCSSGKVDYISFKAIKDITIHYYCPYTSRRLSLNLVKNKKKIITDNNI